MASLISFHFHTGAVNMHLECQKQPYVEEEAALGANSGPASY